MENQTDPKDLHHDQGKMNNHSQKGVAQVKAATRPSQEYLCLEQKNLIFIIKEKKIDN